MMFNEKELYKNYKEMCRTCLLDGCPLPFLIDNYNVPSKYKYNLTEKQKLYDKVSKKNWAKYADRLMLRRKTELNILNKQDKNYKNIKEYYFEELTNFINEYNDFKNILSADD